MPVAFGGRITKPLVRYFMCNQGFVVARSIDSVFRVKDRVRIFKTSPSCLRLDICQFLIVIRSDVPMKIVQYFRRYCKVDESLDPVLWINPAFNRDVVYFTNILNCETGNSDNHYFYRNVLFLAPVCEFLSMVPETLFYFNSIRDDRIMKRCLYNEVDLSLVARVIDYGQPMPAPVRPVIPKESAIAKFVFAYCQAVSGNPVVGNTENAEMAFFNRLVEEDP